MNATGAANLLRRLPLRVRIAGILRRRDSCLRGSRYRGLAVGPAFSIGQFASRLSLAFISATSFRRARPMSQLGQTRTSRPGNATSVVPPRSGLNSDIAGGPVRAKLRHRSSARQDVVYQQARTVSCASASASRGTKLGIPTSSRAAPAAHDACM